MTIEDGNDKYEYEGMQQTVKAKVVNLLQEKSEEQSASDESSDMNESAHSDQFFDFFYKTSNNTWWDSAIKIFKSFFVQKPQRQISLSIV